MLTTLKQYPSSALIAVFKETGRHSISKNSENGIIKSSGYSVRYSWVPQIIINKQYKRLLICSTEKAAKKDLTCHHNFYTIGDLISIMQRYPDHSLWSFNMSDAHLTPIKYCKMISQTNYVDEQRESFIVNCKTLLLAGLNSSFSSAEVVA